MDACVRTAMTRRRPSRTSRSCRLSSNFLICCAGNGLVGLRGPTSLAASRVRSRAWVCVSYCFPSDHGRKAYIPVSSRPLMREMDSMSAVRGERECMGVLACFLDRSREAGWKRWSCRTSDFTAKEATTIFLNCFKLLIYLQTSTSISWARKNGENDHGTYYAYCVQRAGIALQTCSTVRLSQPWTFQQPPPTASWLHPGLAC
jgi:hypothetical protein